MKRAYFIFLFISLVFRPQALADEEIRQVVFGHTGTNEIRELQLSEFWSSCRITIRHNLTSGSADENQLVSFIPNIRILDGEGAGTNGTAEPGNPALTDAVLAPGGELSYIYNLQGIGANDPTNFPGTLTQVIYCGGTIRVKDSNPEFPRSVVASGTLVNFVQGTDSWLGPSSWHIEGVPIYTQSQILINRGMGF